MCELLLIGLIIYGIYLYQNGRLSNPFSGGMSENAKYGRPPGMNIPTCNRRKKRGPKR